MSQSLVQIEKLLLRLVTTDGYWVSPVAGVSCTRISAESEKEKRRWQRRFAFVVSGEKEIKLGPKTHHCVEGVFTITPIDLPVTSRIATASRKKPFLAILIDLDPKLLSEIVSLIGDEENASPVKPADALFVRIASENLIESLARLTKLFLSPAESRILGPALIREILFHALKGNEEEAIRRFVRQGSKTFLISRAINEIQSRLDQKIDVEELASLSNMSRAVFFRYFKQVTTMSPIQYQKRLRLIEAKRLLVEEGESAGDTAYRVGYKSISQFSREYLRMFRVSPSRDIRLFQIKPS